MQINVSNVCRIMDLGVNTSHEFRAMAPGYRLNERTFTHATPRTRLRRHTRDPLRNTHFVFVTLHVLNKQKYRYRICILNRLKTIPNKTNQKYKYRIVIFNRFKTISNKLNKCQDHVVNHRRRVMLTDPCSVCL